MSDSKDYLNIPPHFQEEKVGEIWTVPYLNRVSDAEKWAEDQSIPPSSEDNSRSVLLIIDPQITFCIPGQEMYVGGQSGSGAVEDNIRLCRFIYQNLSRITDIVVTMDTHKATQIFHPLFLVDERGNHPDPGTLITEDDVSRGKWRVSPAAISSGSGRDLDGLQRYLSHYTKALSKGGRYSLIAWPYHAMLGGIGHAVVPAVEEAVFFHGIARQSSPQYELKGYHSLTENYSVLQPEVLEDENGNPLTHKNTELIDKLLSYDRLIIAGQAKSHCVAWTVDDLLTEIKNRDESLSQKVYLLDDCSSPVLIPGVLDFSQQAEDAYQRFSQSGMHRVLSSNPMTEWPNSPY